MSKAGRPQKPTNLKILQGNPGKRPLPENEPKPKPLAAKPPSWIPREAKKIWKDLSSKLEPLGLFTEVDYLEMQTLCIAAAQIREAMKVLGEEGMVMEIKRHDKEGKHVSSYFQQRPEVSIIHKNMDIVNKLSSKFGLSPADRAGLNIAPPKGDDNFKEFLSRGNKKKTP